MRRYKKFIRQSAGVLIFLVSVVIGSTASGLSFAQEPLSVTSIYIPDGATDVPALVEFYIYFSDSVDTTSINAGTIFLTDSSGGLAPSEVQLVGVSQATAILTVSSVPLAPGETHTIHVTTGVQDIFGNSLPAEFTSSFTTLAAFTPVAPPFAPLITGIEPGNGQVSISVSVADDGGSPITGYTAYCFGDMFSFGSSPASPITVSGLTNGVSYTCAATATNDIGASPASAFAPVTPLAPPPGC